MNSDISLGFGGDSRDDRGITTTLNIVIDLLTHLGYNVNSMQTFPAEIEGGQVYGQVRVNPTSHVLNPGDKATHLICFNQLALDENRERLQSDSIVFYDPMKVDPSHLPETNILYEVPLTSLAKKEFGYDTYKNTILIGTVFQNLGVDKVILEKFIEGMFLRKGRQVVELNLKALKTGYNYMNSLPKQDEYQLPKVTREKPIKAINGNQALALGAIAGGVRYAFSYPITPASTLFETLAKLLPCVGGKALQMEDELASVNAVAGAGLAGQLALTPTSGPGLSLMQEGLGLLWMAEIPSIVVDVQRVGPATGSPTKTEQADLAAALFGAHGDANKVVLAPSNVPECITIAKEACTIALKQQMPVVILTDQKIATRRETVTVDTLNGFKPNFEGGGPSLNDGGDGDYKRFRISQDGVSSMAIPGRDRTGMYTGAGIDHDELGHPNYDAAVRYAMRTKREVKLKAVSDMVSKPFLELGSSTADLGIISWGSTQGIVEEAIKLACDRGMKVKGLHLQLLNPLPDDAVMKFLGTVKQVLAVEESFHVHIANIIRARYLVNAARMGCSSGYGFTVNEMLQTIESYVSMGGGEEGELKAWS